MPDEHNESIVNSTTPPPIDVAQARRQQRDQNLAHLATERLAAQARRARRPGTSQLNQRQLREWRYR
jgi:hypothetical protein